MPFQTLLLVLCAVCATGCYEPIDEILVMGDSWGGCSIPHIASQIEANECKVLFDSAFQPLQQGGGRLVDWPAREADLRAELDARSGQRTLIWLSLGGADALQGWSDEQMQSAIDDLMDVLGEYENVEVLHLSYNDVKSRDPYTGEIIDYPESTSEFYRLYSVLPLEIPYPDYAFVILHDVIDAGPWVDLLHLSSEAYRARVEYVWENWIRPRVVCEVPTKLRRPRTREHMASSGGTTAELHCIPLGPLGC